MVNVLVAGAAGLSGGCLSEMFEEMAGNQAQLEHHPTASNGETADGTVANEPVLISRGICA